MFPQGFISGFALISPWAMQEYRPKGLIYVFTTNQLLETAGRSPKGQVFTCSLVGLSTKRLLQGSMDSSFVSL